jgi:hypothetical protein
MWAPVQWHSWVKCLNVLALVGNGTGEPSTLMRRSGISLSLLLGCVSRLATCGARVSLGALRGMPDNRYQRLWPFIPTRGFLGTV